MAAFEISTRTLGATWSCTTWSPILAIEPKSPPVDDLVAHLEGVQELLDLLLLLLHGKQDHEIENRQYEREGNELDERADLLTRGSSQREQGGEQGIRRGHEINARRAKVRWKACLKSSNLPNAIASLIRRMVSR